MQKIHITLLIILSSVFFSAGAIAQNKPLACYEEAKAGLDWENGRWNTKTFYEQKFILVQTEDGLTTASVAKVFVGATSLPIVSCRNVHPQISCTDVIGNSLYFDPRTLKGGLSRLSRAGKDTVTVSVFSCTPF